MLRHIPNVITIFRLVLIVPIVMLLHEGLAGWALVLFFTASVSDGLDGFLARRYGWISAFGRMIDPAADKLLLVATAVTLTLLDCFPPMLLWLMIAKDITVIGGLVVYTLLAGFPLIKPIWFGKFTTVVQLLLLGVIIFNQYLLSPALGEGVIPSLYWLVAIFTLVDGCSYVWLWTSRLTEDPRWNGAVKS